MLNESQCCLMSDILLAVKHYNTRTDDSTLLILFTANQKWVYPLRIRIYKYMFLLFVDYEYKHTSLLIVNLQSFKMNIRIWKNYLSKKCILSLWIFIQL